jgi:hypothetical protein
MAFFLRVINLSNFPVVKFTQSSALPLPSVHYILISPTLPILYICQQTSFDGSCKEIIAAQLTQAGLLQGYPCIIIGFLKNIL